MTLLNCLNFNFMTIEDFYSVTHYWCCSKADEEPLLLAQIFSCHCYHAIVTCIQIHKYKYVHAIVIPASNFTSFQNLHLRCWAHFRDCKMINRNQNNRKLTDKLCMFIFICTRVCEYTYFELSSIYVKLQIKTLCRNILVCPFSGALEFTRIHPP